MDLSGHHRFQHGQGGANGDATRGEAMLAAGWTALAMARAESLDIRLSSGALIAGVLALRIDGALVEASTVRGQWTHYFPVGDVAMVRVVPRGGKPCR